MDEEIKALAEKLAKSVDEKAELAEFRAVIQEIGPENIKATVATLSPESQEFFAKSLERLKKAVSMDKEAQASTGPDAKQEESEEIKPVSEKDRKKNKSEDMVKDSNAKVSPQGDDSEIKGQIIKSEDSTYIRVGDKNVKVEDSEIEKGAFKELAIEELEKGELLHKMIEKMRKRGMDHDVCMSALQKKGYDVDMAKGKWEEMKKMDAEAAKAEKKEEKVTKADIGGELGFEVLKKALYNKMEKVFCDKPRVENKEDVRRELMRKITEMKELQDVSYMVEREMPELKDDLEAMYTTLKKKCKELAAKASKLKKSEGGVLTPEIIEEGAAKAVETSGSVNEQPLSVKKSIKWDSPNKRLEVSFKRGQNAHYGVDGYLAKSFENTPEKEETLEKSEEVETPKFNPNNINDVIEKGYDRSATDVKAAISTIQKSKGGEFNTASFSDEQLAKSFGMSVEEMNVVLRKPQAQKPLNKSEEVSEPAPKEENPVQSQPVDEKMMESGMAKETANQILTSQRQKREAEGIEKSEGARGGKVIGHTKTGKPIYDSHDHEAHAGFTQAEHKQASKIHVKLSDAADEKAGILGSKEGSASYAQSEGHSKAAMKMKMAKKKAPVPPTREQFKNMSASEHYTAAQKHDEASDNHSKAGNSGHSDIHRDLERAHSAARDAHSINSDKGPEGSPRHKDRTEQGKDSENHAFEQLGSAQEKHIKMGDSKPEVKKSIEAHLSNVGELLGKSSED